MVVSFVPLCRLFCPRPDVGENKKETKSPWRPPPRDQIQDVVSLGFGRTSGLPKEAYTLIGAELCTECLAWTIPCRKISIVVFCFLVLVCFFRTFYPYRWSNITNEKVTHLHVAGQILPAPWVDRLALPQWGQRPPRRTTLLSRLRAREYSWLCRLQQRVQPRRWISQWICQRQSRPATVHGLLPRLSSAAAAVAAAASAGQTNANSWDVVALLLVFHKLCLSLFCHTHHFQLFCLPFRLDLFQFSFFSIRRRYYSVCTRTLHRPIHSCHVLSSLL